MKIAENQIWVHKETLELTILIIVKENEILTEGRYFIGSIDDCDLINDYEYVGEFE